MMKRGEIEIQFNWIFVLIVGALILGLFFTITQTIRKSSQESLDYDMLNYLGDIFSTAETSINTERSVSLAGRTLKLDCDFYSLEDGEYEESIQTKVVFSPNRVENNALTFATYWNAPFMVSSFMFISSPTIEYILVGPADLTTALRNVLPENLNAQIINSGDLGSYENHNNYKVRFVLIGGDPNSIPNIDFGIKDNQVTAITINPSNPSVFPGGFGEIEFFKKDGVGWNPQGNTQYLNEGLLLGAVYSEDIELYECNVEKSTKRLSLLSQHLSRRIQDIGDGVSGCVYSAPISTLASIKNSAESRDLDGISSAAITLENQNQELQYQSCPVIY